MSLVKAGVGVGRRELRLRKRRGRRWRAVAHSSPGSRGFTLGGRPCCLPSIWEGQGGGSLTCSCPHPCSQPSVTPLAGPVLVPPVPYRPSHAVRPSSLTP